jgi:hypothetical protein
MSEFDGHTVMPNRTAPVKAAAGFCLPIGITANIAFRGNQMI